MPSKRITGVTAGRRAAGGTSKSAAIAKTTGNASKVATTAKKDVDSARLSEQIRVIERQGKIAAWNDYLGFAVSKILGTGGLLIGGLEVLDPNILPVVLKSPEMIAGVSLALLTGKNIVSLIANFEKTFGGKK